MKNCDGKKRNRSDRFMAWQSSIDIKDKLFAALVYGLPLVDAIPFGVFLFNQFPFLQYLYVPLQPIILIYSAIPLGSLIVFFVLFLAVIRNMNISRFIRFNAMQAILIGILLSLFGLIFRFLINAIGADNIVIETLSNVIFIGTWAACIYSIVQSVRGIYAELPTISEAANSQTP
jgi:uncharacterized membrane protein